MINEQMKICKNIKFDCDYNIKSTSQLNLDYNDNNFHNSIEGLTGFHL